MAFDISSLNILGNSLSSMIPDSSSILSNIALGAATSVVVAGFKSSQGQDALDPLHLFHKDAPANNPNAVVGATITSSAFAALPATTQTTLIASGVHIVAG